MRHLDAHVTKQLIVGETPPLVGIPCLGIGPLRMRGSAYMEGPVLIGQPQAYPTPMLPEATFMLSPGLNVPDSLKQVSIFKVTNKFTPNAAAPNPLDIMLGDPTIGTVGITINASVINTIVDTLHNYVCPITNWVGILNHTGIENLMGAKNLIGSEIIAAIKAQVGAEVRSGAKCDNGARVINGSLVAGPSVIPNIQGKCSGNKSLPFDIPHFTKKGKRIRHIVTEGPEPGIYIRGHLKDKNIIDLPEYWNGLVDPETITVTLTPFGRPQNLYVDSIPYGRQVIVKAEDGSQPNCHYEIWVSRWLDPLDHEKKLHVVYDGETPDDYPGDPEDFLVGGWDYDRRETNWRRND